MGVERLIDGTPCSLWRWHAWSHVYPSPCHGVQRSGLSWTLTATAPCPARISPGSKWRRGGGGRRIVCCPPFPARLVSRPFQWVQKRPYTRHPLLVSMATTTRPLPLRSLLTAGKQSWPPLSALTASSLCWPLFVLYYLYIYIYMFVGVSLC